MMLNPRTKGEMKQIESLREEKKAIEKEQKRLYERKIEGKMGVTEYRECWRYLERRRKEILAKLRELRK